MIGPYIESLNRLRIILASASPRRKELLEQIRLKFEVIPSSFEENLDKNSLQTPQDYALKTSELKAKQVAESVGTFDIIISCDTIVALKGKIFEKPDTSSAAIRMLSELSGHSNEVHTGVTIVTQDGAGSQKFTSFTETTSVEFCALTDDIILTYVKSGESLDKAGAYGIQGQAAAFIKGINGDYNNVVGFPLNHFCRQLLMLIRKGEIRL